MPADLKRHVLVHKKEEMLFCNRCHKGFKQLARLIQHKKEDHSSIGGAHTCRVCAKRFGTLRELNRHGIAHLGNKQYECGVCLKGFNVLYHLKQHTKVMHHGLKPYSCGVCHEKFGSIYFLKKHLYETHQGDSPHKCDLCGKACIHAAALVQHKISVHKDSAENN